MRNLFVLILALAVPAAALAQSTPDVDICAGTSGTADERIAACTRAITSGQLSTASLAITFHNRGVEWSNKRDYDRAIADYNEALRLNPQYAIAYSNRGNAWSYKRDYDRAIADYNEALRLNPQYANAYHYRGNAWRDKGDAGRMMADYDEALRIEPANAARHNTIAWLLATHGNDKVRGGKRAIELAQKACELTAWKVASHIDTLAAAHAEAGQFAEAVRWQEKVLEFPDFAKNADIQKRLALYRAGNPYRQ